MSAPLIVTLRVDPVSQERFQAARDRWFPSDRNVVPAHLTLFHHLPGERVGDVQARLARIGQETSPLPFRVNAVMSLGRGAAYRLDLPGGAGLRSRIARGFDLTPQDAGGWRPHVTVQNKVSKEEAAATLADLRAGFTPWEGRAVALDLWFYRGGPWEAAGHAPLTGDTPDPSPGGSH